MRTLRRLPLLLAAALSIGTMVGAKCPTGSVTVRGRVGNLPSTAAGLEVTVVVESRNGPVTRTASLSNGEFTVEVPFSTHSSSFLGSDRCHTVPTFVEVKVVTTGKVYVQKRINFKDSFEMTRQYEYRLKQELSLEVPNDRTNGTN